MFKFSMIKALVLKDWKEFFRYKNSLLPMLIVPLLFCVVLPLGLGIAFKTLPEKELLADADTVAMVNVFIQKATIPKGLSLGETFPYVMTVYSFMPMFFIVPIMFSSITSAYSIVGEKEAKTIEGLLYTPVSNKELLTSKILSSFIPSMAITFISFLIYSLIINSLFWSATNALIFPNITWIIGVLLFSPVISFASICLMVLTSAKAKSAIEAQQNSGFLVLPIILLFISQLSGVAYLSPTLLLVLTFIVGIIDYFLIKIVAKKLSREEIAVAV